MRHFQIIVSSPALTNFKHAALKSKINCDFNAFYFYLVDSPSLSTLFEADDSSCPFKSTLLISLSGTQTNSHFVYVLPRIHTTSPWSSKARDIATISGYTFSTLERGIVYVFNSDPSLFLDLLYDKMTQSVYRDFSFMQIPISFSKSVEYVDIIGKSVDIAKSLIINKNVELGLALSSDEIEYLITNFSLLKRNPSDVELMMFSQGIFNLFKISVS